jgi:hypothetical protein
MIDRGVNRSRRKIIRAAVKGVSAGLLLGLTAAQASDKMTQRQAEYQDTPSGLFNNYAGAEEANRRALAWIETDLAPLLVGPATAVAGPVIVHTLA